MNQFTEQKRRRREPWEVSAPSAPKQPKQPVYSEAAMSRSQPSVGAPPMSFSDSSGIIGEVRHARRITGVPFYADPSQIRNPVKPQTDPGSRKPVFSREGGTDRPEPVAAVPIRKAARRPNTGPDALAANKAKQTEDIWGTKAPKTEPLRPPVSNKTAAQNPPEEYTNPPQNGILEADPPVQQPVLPVQTTVDTAPVSNRTRLLQQGHTLPPVLPSAWKPSAQHAPQLTVDTAPVSNRTALFGAEEGEPDLALLAKKLEQLADLYREFTPAQKADVERLYRNDPAGLAVIQGRTTGGDWLKEQRRTEAARAAAAAQRKEQAARTLAADPAVQADAIRGKELLHTPGAAKAVTENTQPAYYSAEMFAADPRRAEVAAQRKEQILVDSMNSPASAKTAMLGGELVVFPGSFKDVATSVNKEVINDATVFLADVLKICFPSAKGGELRNDIMHFDLANQNENVALASKWFSAYKGKLVLRLPKAKSSVSFGAIGLQVLDANKQLLQHEYGHTQQLEEYGVLQYTLGVALPSLIGYAAYEARFNTNYYGAPWEAEADDFGGVVREGRTPWRKEWYLAYDLYHNYIAPYIKATARQDESGKYKIIWDFIDRCVKESQM